MNCTKMAGDRPRQPAYEILSIKRRFQQSKSLLARRPAQAGIKDGSPPQKSGYFTALGSFSGKAVADRHRHAACHNKR